MDFNMTFLLDPAGYAQILSSEELTMPLILENPLKKTKKTEGQANGEQAAVTAQAKSSHPDSPYEKALKMGQELVEKPFQGGGTRRITIQHSKDRMTVFERIKVLTQQEPNLIFQNWGNQLDGAGIVTMSLL